jgi:hypothetical protein
MTSILSRIRDISIGHHEPGVHFHGGLGGPYVCENPRCTSPHLAEEDALQVDPRLR